MTDAELCALVNHAFVGVPRPEHFTDYTHCEECAEHDTLLRSRKLDTLNIEDVDNPGWDPICFLNAEGWRYYFSALVRLSFADLENSYISQFLFHLSYPKHEGRFSLFDDQQKQSVVAFLQHLREHHIDIVRECYADTELAQAIQIWEAR